MGAERSIPPTGDRRGALGLCQFAPGDFGSEGSFLAREVLEGDAAAIAGRGSRSHDAGPRARCVFCCRVRAGDDKAVRELRSRDRAPGLGRPPRPAAALRLMGRSYTRDGPTPRTPRPRFGRAFRQRARSGRSKLVHRGFTALTAAAAGAPTASSTSTAAPPRWGNALPARPRARALGADAHDNSARAGVEAPTRGSRRKGIASAGWVKRSEAAPGAERRCSRRRRGAQSWGTPLGQLARGLRARSLAGRVPIWVSSGLDLAALFLRSARTTCRLRRRAPGKGARAGTRVLAAATRDGRGTNRAVEVTSSSLSRLTRHMAPCTRRTRCARHQPEVCAAGMILGLTGTPLVR